MNDQPEGSFSSADNAINGVPTCAERGLLTQVLREQWGFEGFVVSDYDAWVFMAIRDGPTPFAKTVPEAAVLGEHDRLRRFLAR